MEFDTIDDLHKIYYLTYNAYADEGYIAAFSRTNRAIVVFKQLDCPSAVGWSKKWSEIGSQKFDDLRDCSFIELCDRAVNVIHALRKPF